MFDALKRLFGSKPLADSEPSAPAPSAPAWEPIDKMDAALGAAIRLFARAVEQAGKGCGKLSLPGAPPKNVVSLLADSVVFTADGGDKFLTLGQSQDLKTFLYAPHVQLYTILSVATLLESDARQLSSKVVLAEVPRALLHAQMMKRWIRFIQPTGDALRTQADREERLTSIMRGLKAEVFSIARTAPGWIWPDVDANEAVESWTKGYPAALSHYLGADTPRISGLPMSQPAADAILNLLAATQADGARQPRRAAA
jgi:hypothetical protein